MRVRIARNHNWWSQIILDDQSFCFEEYADLEREPNNPLYQIQEVGVYDYLDDELVMLLCLNGAASVFFKNNFYTINSGLTLKREKGPELIELKLFQDGVQINRLFYQVITDEPFNTYAYLETEEDVDFGLYLYNVLSDEKNRAHSIKRCSTEGK